VGIHEIAARRPSSEHHEQLGHCRRQVDAAHHQDLGTATGQPGDGAGDGAGGERQEGGAEPHRQRVA
jgi:hypothetical protein